MIEHTKYVLNFEFLYNFVSNIFYSKKNWARYDQKCTLVFTWSILYSCPVSMNLEFFRQIFEKKFRLWIFKKMPPVEDEVFHADRRKGGQTRRSWQSLFEILRTRQIKTEIRHYKNVYLMLYSIYCCMSHFCRNVQFSRKLLMFNSITIPQSANHTQSHSKTWKSSNLRVFNNAVSN